MEPLEIFDERALAYDAVVACGGGLHFLKIKSRSLDIGPLLDATIPHATLRFTLPMQRRQAVWPGLVFMYLLPQVQSRTTTAFGLSIHLPSF
jgi:hypothetical protein